MTRVRVTHSVRLPDPLKVSRYRKLPELGPNLLFFSGGTALTGISRTLKEYTHNSIHLVTPFDSGGSSAILRQAFDMPAIGDLRSRLMALADESVTGHPEIYRLFTFRFPKDQPNKVLKARLEAMVNGKDPLVDDIANPMRQLICNHLGFFMEAMPKGFDLSGASIGNLILAGGYINNHNDLEPILFLFSKLVNVQGTVRAIVDDDYHLKARLSEGEEILGQHRLTGKEVDPLRSPIESLSLCRGLDDPRPARAELRKRNRKLIQNADLICYPPGSFYSSLVANLLPDGVSEAIAKNPSPKVYVPNLGHDPEQLGMTLEMSLQRLLGYLSAGNQETPATAFLDFILLDSKAGDYPGGVPDKLCKTLGIEVIDMSLINPDKPERYDPVALVQALLSLA